MQRKQEQDSSAMGRRLLSPFVFVLLYIVTLLLYVALSSVSSDVLTQQSLLTDGTSTRARKQELPVGVEEELARARAAIRYAATTAKPSKVSLNIYRNEPALRRSYAAMEKWFKVYVYEEGEPPLVHDGPCKNIYTTEGRFIHELEMMGINANSNSSIRTRDPDKAHVFFLPVSVTNLRRFIKEMSGMKLFFADYVNVIASKYGYSNRTSGADHLMQDSGSDSGSVTLPPLPAVSADDWFASKTDDIVKDGDTTTSSHNQDGDHQDDLYESDDEPKPINENAHCLISNVFYRTTRGDSVYAHFAPNCSPLPDPSLSFLLKPVVVMASAAGLLCCHSLENHLYNVYNPLTTASTVLPSPINDHGDSVAVLLVPETGIDDIGNVEYHLVCVSTIKDGPFDLGIFGLCIFLSSFFKKCTNFITASDVHFELLHPNASFALSAPTNTDLYNLGMVSTADNYTRFLRRQIALGHHHIPAFRRLHTSSAVLPTLLPQHSLRICHRSPDGFLSNGVEVIPPGIFDGPDVVVHGLADDISNI